MKKQLLALLAVAVVATSAANAAVSITGEGSLGLISDGKGTNLGNGQAGVTGFTNGLGTAAGNWFNNSVYLTGDIAKDTSFYSELQFSNTNTLIVNELNVTYSGLKFGRFTAPFGYYVPNSVYSSWNKFQRLDLFVNNTGAVQNAFALAPGYETGVMYSGAASALKYSVFAVNGGGSNQVLQSTATVREQLGYGAQLVYGINKDIEIGAAYYTNPNDNVTSYSSSLLNIFGKAGLGALTLWGEYHAGQTAAATAIKQTTILLEADYNITKAWLVAARYANFDPDTAVANNGYSATAVGTEYSLNDYLTLGLDYTMRSQEATPALTDANSITATSQFKF